MKNSLTEKQKKILEFINTFIEIRGYPPTLREIGKNFNISSTFGVNRHLKALEKKGYIIKNTKLSRGISISALNKEIIKKTNSDFSSENKIPIIGRVAAGSPILSEENIEGKILIDYSLIKNSYGCFALKVQGDSMTDIGIFDGDLVIVNPHQSVNYGDLVVARLDGEITVKILDMINQEVFLIPKNKNYKPIKVTGNENFHIVGNVVTLIRLYN